MASTLRFVPFYSKNNGLKDGESRRKSVCEHLRAVEVWSAVE